MNYFKIYETLDSTNKEAHRLLAKGPVLNGLTLFARHQTDGKGQLGRTWISEPGYHMAISIIYQPTTFRPHELPHLNMKISLGIVNALTTLIPGLHFMIKWPNDIYVRGKKLSGILIENSLAGRRVQHSIIGIGMNINEEKFPLEIPNAVSLRILTDQTYDPEIIALLVRKHVLSLLESSPFEWKTAYDEHIFGKGKRHSFISGENIFEATVSGISLDGHLLLQNDAGEIKSYASHEVKWVI